MYQCCNCGVSIENASLYRVNKKGGKAIWNCLDCHPKPEKSVVDIVLILESK